MTDDLVERLLDWPYQGETMAHEAADRIEQLTADKRFILEERDRTFALMLARAEAAEAERDSYRKALEDIIKDYEPGYPLSHDVIKYVARAALKGESHD